ncbi:Serine/threonine-protein kinase D [Madurella mycetomatis]|uniref:Serine/threonine-protein kinase D n=1 Tax=Madurella mycetomatis TaxID=100816 RepID=A0A175VQ74_9PEZI|nr:Serine/threonine-protein kinase D [Madurella mycetomatis]KXX83046.1 Serine/threonine-protein kinase D [Madurella mycetomatis]
MESPYTKGSELSLAVRERGRDRAVPRGQLTVEIIEPMPAPTMSVVMKVSFRDPRSGRQRLAVLKTYDRRFACSLRRTYNPSYDDDAESAWCEYVRDGKAPALFDFLREKRRLEYEEGVLVDTDSESDSSSSEDEHATTITRKRIRTAAEVREKKGKREGIIQWKALELCACETRAYAKLSHLQGRYIPRILAQVHATIATSPDLRSHPAYRDDYFDVGGILLEYVDGFNLTDLGTTSVPKQKWHTIIQQAVDIARYINDAGVINTDCQPRNVIVQRESLRPFHIDFAQCLFAEDIGWEEFQETKVCLGNQGAIGSVMVVKIRRAGVDLPDIQYDNRDWVRLGSIFHSFRLTLTPWSGIGYGVGIGVLAWAVARVFFTFRARN